VTFPGGQSEILYFWDGQNVGIFKIAKISTLKISSSLSLKCENIYKISKKIGPKRLKSIFCSS
jgi:hypothetical protein